MKNLLLNRSNYKRKNSYKKTVVAGVEKGVGATHFSILLANYYAEILGKKTAVIDLNKDNDYAFLEEMCSSGNEHLTDVYKIKRVSYFSGVTKERMAEIFNRNYECIIIDVGENYEYFRNEISMCDKKFMIGAINPWRLNNMLMLFKNGLLCSGSRWKYLYTFGDKESVNYVEESVKIKLHLVPNMPNPFRINTKQLAVFEKILWEE